MNAQDESTVVLESDLAIGVTAPDVPGDRRSGGARVEFVAAVIGLLAVILYSVGWVFLTRFYGRFDVDPEEAGRSQLWIVPRAAVLLVPLLALIGLGGAIVGRRQHLIEWIGHRTTLLDRALCGGAAWATFVFAAVIAVILVIGVGAAGDGWLPWLSAGIFVGGTAVAGYAAASAQWGVLAVATCWAVVGLLVTSRDLADTFADRVFRGEDVSFRPFDLGPTVLNVPILRVYAPGHLLDGACASVLGSGPDVVLVHVSVPSDGIHNYTDETWRLSPGDVDLVRFGGATCLFPTGYIGDQRWPEDRPDTRAFPSS